MIDKKPYFEVGIWYSLTLNYADSKQFFGKPTRETKVVNLTNERLLSYTQKRINYILYLELSEPHVGTAYSNGPRLHYHGMIRFRSYAGLKLWLLNDYHDLLQDCIVDIDTIGDKKVWLDYCKKQSKVMNREPLANTNTCVYLDAPCSEHMDTIVIK